MKIIAALLALALVPVLCLAQTTLPGAGTRAPGVDFFTNGAVHRFEVRITPEHLATLRTTPREYVPATVRTGGRTYTNVGVHLKGAATFRPVDDEPSLTLNFSKFSSGQRFHGLRKIHLNNGKEDPTFLCELLSEEMFARAGLPVARVTHAHLILNERDLGTYVAIEGFTPEFLARYFTDTRGNLYDSGFRNDITHPLEQLLGKGPDNWEDLKELVAAAEVPALDERWRRLARHLDTNQFARYLALQVLISNWDGYALYKNNYRIYHDPVSARLHFIPHGMDQTFSRSTAPLMPPRWGGMLARAFIETDEGRTLYQRQLATLYTNTWDTPLLLRRLDELAATIQPLFLAQGPQAVAAHDALVLGLRRRIEQRGGFLTTQFASTNWMNPPVTNAPIRRPPMVLPPPR